MRPAHVAVAILFVGALWIAATPINDIDSYWHVQIGREILQRHTLSGLGGQWLGASAPSWRTSQWLSEVGMYLAVDRFGWLALPVLRLLTACALFAVYAVTLVRRRQPVASFIVLVILVIGMETLLQDRPATISLVFVALLAAACERLWTTGRRPPPAAVALATLVWAQFHGLWVLAPAAFLLVAIGGLLDRRRAPAGQVRGALVSGAASMTGILNPQGLVSFLLPIRFRNSAGIRISEWAPTQFTMVLTVSWGLLICLLVLAWVRSSRRVPTTELIWVFCWTVFAVMAVRNVGPAILLTAPVALRALEASVGPHLDRRLSPTTPRENRILAVLLAAVVVVGTAGAAGALARTDPLRNAPALGIARRLATADGTLRVWNAYNASGPLIAFGGGAQGHLKLSVDGRSDLWGNAYIERTVDAESLVGSWKQTFDDFHADAVVLEPDAPLAVYLRGTGNWRVAMVDHKYQLLVPRGSRLSEPPAGMTP
ncbi:MAG: hypothetical protein ACXV0U_02205 [Kineosporiaceae bacterium]